MILEYIIKQEIIIFQFMEVKNFIISSFFYPIFIFPYIAYFLAYKLASLIQYFFKVVYIEQVCGFKRNQKVVQALNGLAKRPQEVTLSISIEKHSMEFDQSLVQFELQEKKIIEEYLQILKCVQDIKQINICFDLQTHLVDRIISELEQSLLKQELKKIKIINHRKRGVQEVQKLAILNKSHTPLVMVFSNYEGTCGIPPKYLINAQVSFNSNILISTNYDIYKSFLQYANSKQRNGK